MKLKCYRRLLSYLLLSIILFYAMGAKRFILTAWAEDNWNFLTVEIKPGGGEIKLWQPQMGKFISTSLSPKVEYVLGYENPTIEEPSFGLRKVLFVRRRASQNKQELVMVNISNTAEECILHESRFLKSPILSPDGMSIAFLAAEEQYDGISLFTLTLSSMRIQTIVQNNVSIGGTYNANISWMPDSQHVLYTDTDGTIRSVDILTKETQVFVKGFDPIVSPDGQKILLKKSPFKPYKPFIYNLQKNEMKEISISNIYNATWTPDGKFLVLVKMSSSFFNWNGWMKEVFMFNYATKKTTFLFKYQGYEYIDCSNVTTE